MLLSFGEHRFGDYFIIKAGNSENQLCSTMPILKWNKIHFGFFTFEIENQCWIVYTHPKKQDSIEDGVWSLWVEFRCAPDATKNQTNLTDIGCSVQSGYVRWTNAPKWTK